MNIYTNCVIYIYIYINQPFADIATAIPTSATGDIVSSITITEYTLPCLSCEGYRECKAYIDTQHKEDNCIYILHLH